MYTVKPTPHKYKKRNVLVRFIWNIRVKKESDIWGDLPYNYKYKYRYGSPWSMILYIVLMLIDSGYYDWEIDFSYRRDITNLIESSCKEIDSPETS